MKIINTKINENLLNDKNLNFISNEDCFFDIETTGLSPDSNIIYLIGLGCRINNEFLVKQFLIENDNEEKELLEAFCTTFIKFENAYSYNGDSFDLNFIRTRLLKNKLSYDISKVNSVDLYKIIKPFKEIFKLPNLKQPTIEDFLGIDRGDDLSGKELIEYYKKYSISHNISDENLLIYHNYSDVLGMFKLMEMYDYINIFTGAFVINESEIIKDRDYFGSVETKLKIVCKLDKKIKRPFSYGKYNIYLSASEDAISLLVPVIDDKIMLPYKNIKDYYYIPSEDMAVLKELADGIPKENKIKANKTNCYGRITLTETLLNDVNQLKKYVIAIFDYLLRN